jgi:hypothetical protein
MTDLANNAAAVSAGYARVQTDRGAGRSPRYTSRYEKPMASPAGDAGYLEKAEGNSDVDQATADTNALTALNGQRRLRYGADAAAGKTGRGNQHTFDN